MIRLCRALPPGPPASLFHGAGQCRHSHTLAPKVQEHVLMGGSIVYMLLLTESAR